jgi:hypothetical protein
MLLDLLGRACENFVHLIFDRIGGGRGPLVQRVTALTRFSNRS